jgi:hypothetical protein
MDDVTPLNLEDSPKLFGMRFDQLIWILVSFVVSTQLWSWMMPINLAGQDIKIWICIFVGMIGPFTHWSPIITLLHTGRTCSIFTLGLKS